MLDAVMYASRYSPLQSRSPKQMLVVNRSPVAMCSVEAPSGEMTVIPPLTRVATHTLPSPSTATSWSAPCWPTG